MVELRFIQPGKPTENVLIERFNRTLRTEVLDRYIFNSMSEMRQMLEDWRHRYNRQRPYSALGMQRAGASACAGRNGRSFVT